MDAQPRKIIIITSPTLEAMFDEILRAQLDSMGVIFVDVEQSQPTIDIDEIQHRREGKTLSLPIVTIKPLLFEERPYWIERRNINPVKVNTYRRKVSSRARSNP